jgi:hypothetical protein
MPIGGWDKIFRQNGGYLIFMGIYHININGKIMCGALPGERTAPPDIFCPACLENIGPTAAWKINDLVKNVYIGNMVTKAP